MAELATPEFLQNHSVSDIFAKLKTIMPADIDLSEGGHAYNFLIASALVLAEAYEYTLPEVIKLIFPTYSYGEFLDHHAKTRGLTRKSATSASGYVTVTGKANVTIPAGSLFSTATTYDETSMLYESLETVEIPASRTVKVGIRCTQPGPVGNTGKDTVILVASRLIGVTTVTNEEPITGGTEEETDESLIERIAAYDKSQGSNYVGSMADYKRWATSVDGVGSATIIPAQDTSGLVTIVLTDANGEPATEQLCESVYNYIMKPDSPYERLAPVNALLLVVPPDTMEISISAVVELADDATLESVKASFAALLTAYLATAMDEGEIKYTRVAAALAAAEGANDYSNLQIGLKEGDTVSYSTSNIAITSSQLPAINLDDLILTAGTV